MRRIFRRMHRLFKGGPYPTILMYHRVADLPYDPWGLSVTPQRFAEQMKAIKDSRIPVSMTEFVGRLREGTLPRRAIAVTFDDGYVDNLTYAKPILEQAGVPATVFLTTGQLGRGTEFWWDELARLILGSVMAADGSILIAGQTISVRLPAIGPGVQARTAWHAWQDPNTEREKLYYESWNILQKLDVATREHAMQSIRNAVYQGEPDPTDLPMVPEDVGKLASGPWIEVGAHSRTHRPLTALSPCEQRREIQGSRTDCESLLGYSVNGFAYPHGDRNATTMEMVRQSGFDWACSTYGAAVNPNRFDRFDLPRLQAMNWDRQEFERELRNAPCDI